MSDISESRFCKLTPSMSEAIRLTRKSLHLTQNDVAKAVSISIPRYSRIETNSIKNVEIDVLSNVLEFLGLEMDSVQKRFGTRVSFTIPQEMKSELIFLKNLKELDTVSETIKYCIRFTLDSYYKSKISEPLLNEIKEILNATYDDQISKMSLDLSVKNLILETMSGDSTRELNDIQNNLKKIFMNYSHVKNE